MHIERKIVLALLSLAIALPTARATARPQDDPAAPTPGVDQPAWPDGPDAGRRDRPGDGGWRGGSDWGRGGRMEMRGHGGPGREFLLTRLVDNPAIRERLGITPEQAAQIRQQTSDFRKSEIRSRADIEVKRLELRDLLAADNPDRSAIDRKLEEISTARLAQEKSAVGFQLTMRNALTAEQKQKLEQMREEFQRRGPRDGRHGPQGPTPNRPPQGAPPAPGPSGEE